MTGHRSPATEAERRQLEKIASRWRYGAAAAPLLLLLGLGGRLLPQPYYVLSIAAGVVAAGVGIGWFIYLSFFQRCPRCSGWIGAAPKCLACGIKLEPEYQAAVGVIRAFQRGNAGRGIDIRGRSEGCGHPRASFVRHRRGGARVIRE